MGVFLCLTNSLKFLLCSLRAIQRLLAIYSPQHPSPRPGTAGTLSLRPITLTLPSIWFNLPVTLGLSSRTRSSLAPSYRHIFSGALFLRRTPQREASTPYSYTYILPILYLQAHNLAFSIIAPSLTAPLSLLTSNLLLGALFHCQSLSSLDIPSLKLFSLLPRHLGWYPLVMQC